MKFAVLLSLGCVLLYSHSISCESVDEYMRRRQVLKQSDASLRTGADVILSEKEQAANALLMHFKNDVYESSIDTSDFVAAKHFFHVKEAIEQSLLYTFIRLMPKGGALHLHDYGLVDLNWVVNNATYRPYLYICVDLDVMQFKFFDDQGDLLCNWQNITDFRDIYGKELVDSWIMGNLSMVVEDPFSAYPNQNEAWKKFEHYFQVAGGLVFSSEVISDYVYQTLQEFYDDNVQYLEMRALLNPIYDLDGTVHDMDYTVKAYYDVIEKFKQDHPDFIGAKIIYTKPRSSSKEVVGQAVKDTVRLSKEYPGFVIGFDLVGHEDPGHPLSYFINELLYPSQLDPPASIKYFFHAGETDWQQTDVDENLFDALLLNTSRIGHGYALMKHAVSKQQARESGIAVEINPISNQVLGLVTDLRDHPGAALLAEGYPVVISSDDAPVWGARGLSFDFYMVFLAFGNDNVDLATLKQLASNSIEYSALSNSDKVNATAIWTDKWNLWIDNMQVHYRQYAAKLNEV